MTNIRKVMVVDDEPDIRRIGQVSLAGVGRLEVCLAASGAEALASIDRERPDVVLLDVMMPEKDGLETLAELQARESTASIPVIMMTAKARTADLERYLALGAAGMIGKPFDPLLLPGQIKKLLEKG